MRRLIAGIVTALVLTAAAPALAQPPLRQYQWGLDMIQADPAHARVTGRGAVVAVVDTGVRLDHPDLQGQLLPGYDFVSPGGSATDSNGHGTHVAGIIAANSNNSFGIEGVAPQAKILPVRVLDASGSGDTTTIDQGIDWAANHGADVINLSLGDSLPVLGLGDSEFAAAVNRAAAKGIVVVLAAGNNSLPLCEQPATQLKVLCVGAVDRSGQVASYSDSGLRVDLYAPGGLGTGNQADYTDDVLSTFYDSAKMSDTYAALAGTSMAAPHVSGLAALLVSGGLRGQGAIAQILATTAPNGVIDANAATVGLSMPATPSSGGSSSAGGPTAISVVGGSIVVRVTRFQKRRPVLRKGILLRVHSPRSGRVSARARNGGVTIAIGSATLHAGRTIVLHLRLTAAGRRLLSHRRSLGIAITVTLPGGGVRQLSAVIR